ncbi:MAG: PCMD domain-containing protein [Clostridium sp.]|nr:PCMD domain-containing protein [Clostridium sp.]
MKRLLFIAALFPILACAQGKESFHLLKYGNMDSWVTRKIQESAIIGHDWKTLYEVGPEQTVEGAKAYKNLGGSPWATSNVYARVAGVNKTNTSVFREDRPGHGSCARLETRIEKVKVLGLVDISVIAAGSLFLGDMKEPITGTKDAVKNLNWGIPFTKRPSAVQYDYKLKIMPDTKRTKMTGFGKKQTVPGQDCAITVLYLQKRTEQPDGSITAERVGTMVKKYTASTNDWINGAKYEILYGDITGNPSYDAETMGLRDDDYARNSKGESVKVVETGWADANAEPTHLILQFSSSHGGAYIGTPGNTMWVDNIGLVY